MSFIKKQETVSMQIDFRNYFRKCKDHPNQNFRYLYINPLHNGSVFKCNYCVCNHSLDGQYLIPVDQIKNSEFTTVLYNWPFPGDQDMSDKLVDSIQKKKNEKLKDQIAEYFQDLKKCVLEKIQEAQSQMEQKALSYLNFGNVLAETYNSYSQKQLLKEIVIDENLELKVASQRVKKVIEETFEKQDELKSNLKGKIEQFNILESSINFEKANKLRDSILSFISQINIFEIDPQQIHFPDVQIPSYGNVKKILDLISNRLNFVSQPFLENIGLHLQKLQSIFDKVDLGPTQEEGRFKLELNRLNQVELLEVCNYIETLIKSKDNLNQRQINSKKLKVEDIMKLLQNKQNFAEDNAINSIRGILMSVSNYVESFDVENIFQQGKAPIQLELEYNKLKELENISKQIHDNNSEISLKSLDELIDIGNQIVKGFKKQPQKQYFNFKDLHQLISNRSNRCSQKQQDNLNNQLKGVQFYLESFEISNEPFIPIDWEGLNEDQLHDLSKLGDQIKILNKTFGSDYQKSTKPMSGIQNSSKSISNLLMENFGERKNEINQYLVRYPIFELLKLELKLNLNTLQCLPSQKFNQSYQYLEILKQNNSILITNKSPTDDKWRQCYFSQALDEDKKYVIQVEINNAFKGYSLFVFGLIDTNNKEDKDIDDDNIFYADGWDYKTINKVIKGQYVHSNQAQQIGKKQLEFRIHLKENIVKVSSLPYYKNVAEINDKNFINRNKNYHFAIQLRNVGDSVKIQNVDEVSFFNGDM